ncbi:hypothetical protein [Mycobacteroides abscessus]|uniref:hypothetical protein n=1 Tax=Mycobacteroides abscessus TaxID=36809 RepID=UPI000925E384|nr:hypothetical protein [Mycobacteroides abscessus]QSM05155.1 hypothetical protein PROPHIGD102-1_60 [Mycobacterium phage prophiGD102-1]MBE5507147.1 hypothetical protein [Mycobacteroides abscessus]MBN7552962.1 hypothetical protein [Mycobacteroides abscessus subsp. abscessus]MDO3044160.1 hypothetical protein [Mycobacteroides abscessus subsp. abscessus]MDO3135620.1 hypothetical protein [Mycobacteroides abscessus subsp. abscessus]
MTDRSGIIRHPANILNELQTVALRIKSLRHRLEELEGELLQVAEINYEMWGRPKPHEDFPKKGD